MKHSCVIFATRDARSVILIRFERKAGDDT